jgi:hypothetical protein
MLVIYRFYFYFFNCFLFTVSQKNVCILFFSFAFISSVLVPMTEAALRRLFFCDGRTICYCGYMFSSRRSIFALGKCLGLNGLRVQAVVGSGWMCFSRCAAKLAQLIALF